jgi:putative transposase
LRGVKSDIAQCRADVRIDYGSVLVAHRIALDPNIKQVDYFKRASGTARFTYNWALTEWNAQYRNGDRPSEAALRRQLNGIKRQQFPWMTEVSKSVIQAAIRNLGDAWSRFFKSLKEAKSSKRKSGQAKFNRPKLKKKGQRDSFYAGTFPEFAIDGKRIRLPVIGWVKMREALRFSGKIRSATVSRDADRWFVSVLVDTKIDDNPVKDEHDFIGVDLGIKTMAECSDGRQFEAPKPLKRMLKALRRLNRRLHRRKIGGKNRAKTREKLARLHYRIKCIRQDCLHEATSTIAKTKRFVVLEDLNVASMLKLRSNARSISDIGFYEFRRQLEYKSKLYGCEVVIADRFFPSSKRCSECGVINLIERTDEWTCMACGVVHQRDENAAKNLEWYGKFRRKNLEFNTDSSSGSYA